MKKILSIVLTLCMVMSLIPAVVFATADDVTFTAIDGTGGTGKEGFAKLLDGNNSGSSATKWCVQNFSGNDTYVVIEASEDVIVTGYTLTTGNDTGTHKGRNPKTWELYGSSDYDTSSKSGTWTAIHTVTDGAMPEASFSSKDFTVSGASGYKYFKLHITAIDGRDGANLFQLTAMEFTYTKAADAGKWFGWTKLTQTSIENYASSGKYVLPAGSYYLDGDITSGKMIELSTNAAVTLDLNGHTLKNSSDYNGDFIRNGYVTDSTTSFTLTDTSTSKTGKIVYSGTECAIYIGKGSSLIANGGIIEGIVYFFGTGGSISNTDSSNVTHFKGGLNFGTGGYTISSGIFYGNFDRVEYGTNKSNRMITFMDGENVYALQVLSGVSKKPIAPVKAGHTLTGWLDGNTLYTFGRSVDYNMTLTARWFEGEDWIELTQDSLENYKETMSSGISNYRLPSGKYYLGEDIAADHIVQVRPEYGSGVSINVTLDLDGHTLSAAPELTGTLLSVSHYGDTNTHTLTLKDSSAGKTGKIVCGEGRYALSCGRYSVLNADGGTVEGKINLYNQDFVISNTDPLNTTHFKGVLFGMLDNKKMKIGGGIFYSNFDIVESSTDDSCHTVTFMDGDVKYAVQVLNGTAVTQLPYAPEKAGCSFDGWYNGDDEFEFGSTIIEDTVLTAKWFERGEGFIKLTAKTLENYAESNAFGVEYVLHTGKYYLGEDITVASDRGISINRSYSGCDHVTLDLNGHTLQKSGTGTLIGLQVRIGDDASSITLIDGSESKTGKLVYNGAIGEGDAIGCLFEGTTIYANGGTVEGSVDLCNKSYIKNTDPTSVTVFKGMVIGRGTIDGGIFDGDVLYGVTINGGTFNGDVTDLETVNGGTFNGDVTDLEIVNGGTFNGSSTQLLIVNGGTFYGPAEVLGIIYGGIFYNTLTFDDTYGYGTYADTAHKITFMNGDDTWAIEVLDGAAVSYEPDAPTKTGWTFDGWYDGGTKFEFGSAITEDVTLTAKWNCTGHVDEDAKDHKCDVCGETIDSCTDPDKDHVCNWCGAPVGTHEDGNTDHVCDYGCDVAIGACEDKDKDHKCDYGCGKDFGTHEDKDHDHVCDYGCKVAIGACEDLDKDHKCDYGCGKDFGTHEDKDHDHVCDYGCKVAIGDCEDTDKDHKCDHGCGKDFGTHEDKDHDHVCDYGCKVAIGACEDLDKDHKCDHGCGKDFGTHEDKDHDHVCDYGCKVAIGDCEDSDKDHKCDYGCGKDFGAHEDLDKDHDCDYCGDGMSDCDDTDPKDHKCDLCGKILSNCSGGKATCRKKAVCGHCGNEYGEVDVSNHASMKHVDAKAATEEAEGNTEYWHCEDCDKYYSDKDGKNEISLSDTVVAKLEPAHQTGDVLFFLIALLLVSGTAMVVTATNFKKRRYSVK